MVARTWMLLLGSLAVCTASALSASAAPLPPVPVPAENPITPEKAVLGKLLFWEEQISSDGTVACGTCHSPAQAGSEANPATHPGPDLAFGTADDIFGSAGVVRRNSSNVQIADSIFGFSRQVTPRSAPNFFGGGLWDSEVFWDGRAGGQFRDPLSNAVALASGGALENQALAPILSDVEMSKEGRTWAEVTAKLAQITPMQTATDLPADMASALAANPTYPELFAAAFGDAAITPVRIAFAIATYERTLVPDQTPWDRFEAGDSSALDATQQNGLNTFMNSNCVVCHAPPLFTDLTFRNIGVRPNSEDLGRQVVTGDTADRGKFATPTLRNVGLKPTFMHNGRLSTLSAVVAFYQEPGPPNTDNRDPLVPSPIAVSQQTALRAFMNAGLVDPRVSAQTAPFDRPTLLPEPGGLAALLAGAAYLALLVRRRGYSSISSQVGFRGSVAGSTQRISA